MSRPTGQDSPRTWPTRPCPLCGRHAEHSGAALPVPVTCVGCGLVFIDPVPAEALSPLTYGSEYYEPWQAREAMPRLRLWRRRLAQIVARRERGSILDVGCGDGHFLQVARQAGWRVDGIEFSPEGARRAAARLGRPVAVGDLARTGHLPGPFDVVTLWHVLEHLEEPLPMLGAVRRRVRPGGLLAVAVPNLDNLPMQAAYRLARGRRLPLYEAGAREPHLSHFSPATLRRLIEMEAFQVIDIVPDRCALRPPLRLIDAVAAWTSRLSGRILTDAIVAFARRAS